MAVRSRNIRVPVKDLTARTGGRRVAVAGQVGLPAGMSFTPLDSSGSKSLSELAGALGSFGANLSKRALLQSEAEQKEGEKEGRSIALKAYREGEQELLKQANSFVKAGVMKHGENPFTVQSMHMNTGVLLARSATTNALLREEMQGWILNKVQTEETNPAGFNRDFMTEIIQPRLDEIINQLPNTEYARDIGFAQAIVPILQKIKGDANALYNKAITDLNFDKASKVVNGFLTQGEYKKAFESVRGTGKDPDDEGDPGLPQLGLQLGPNVDTRKFMFDRVRAHLDTEVIRSPLLGSKYTTSIQKALDNLDGIMNMREPISGALVKDPAVVKELYGNYKVELQKKLIAAQGREAQLDAANSKLKLEYWENAYTWSATQIPALNATHMETEDGKIVPLDKDLGGVAIATSLPPKDLWDDPARYIELFDSYVRAGLIKRPDNGEVFKHVTDGSKYSTPEVVTADLDESEQLTAIRNVVASINTMIKNGKANNADARLRTREALDRNIVGLYDTLVSGIANMKNFDDEDFEGKWQAMLPQLRALWKHSPLPFDVAKERLDLWNNIKQGYAFKHIGRPVAAEAALFRFIGKNTDKYINLSPLERHAQVIEDLNDAGLAANRPAIDKAFGILEEHGADFFKTHTVSGTAAQKNVVSFKDLLYQEDANLFKVINSKPADQGILGRQFNIAVGKNQAERLLIIRVERFFREHYKPLVKTVFEANKYAGDKSKSELEDILSQKGANPIKDAEGNVILDSSLLHQFLEIPKSIKDAGGQPFADWGEYLQSIIKGEQLDN